MWCFACGWFSKSWCSISLYFRIKLWSWVEMKTWVTGCVASCWLLSVSASWLPTYAGVVQKDSFDGSTLLSWNVSGHHKSQLRRDELELHEARSQENAFFCRGIKCPSWASSARMLVKVGWDEGFYKGCWLIKWGGMKSFVKEGFMHLTHCSSLPVVFLVESNS